MVEERRERGRGRERERGRGRDGERQGGGRKVIDEYHDRSVRQGLGTMRTLHNHQTALHQQYQGFRPADSVLSCPIPQSLGPTYRGEPTGSSGSDHAPVLIMRGQRQTRVGEEVKHCEGEEDRVQPPIPSPNTSPKYRIFGDLVIFRFFPSDWKFFNKSIPECGL
jgi:hypothetical protein